MFSQSKHNIFEICEVFIFILFFSPLGKIGNLFFTAISKYNQTMFRIKENKFWIKLMFDK